MTTISRAAASDLFREAPHRYLDAGQGEVALRSVGEGPDVLFVHGWPVSGATFRGLLPHLAAHVTCHVVDLPGAGASRFDGATALTVAQHIRTVTRVIDQLGVDTVALVGHDSGGLIARHAAAGDPRVRALGLIDTEQPQGLSWRFRSFLLARHLPGFGAAFRRIIGHRRLRRSSLVLGGCFVDDALLDGEFDDLFLRPLRDDPERLAASLQVLRSFDVRLIDELDRVHRQLEVPVHLVWGEDDPFFPVRRAREMVATFPRADLTVVERAALFAHEERPAEVARALLPVLAG